MSNVLHLGDYVVTEEVPVHVAGGGYKLRVLTGTVIRLADRVRVDVDGFSSPWTTLDYSQLRRV